MRTLVFISLLLSSTLSQAQSITGQWVTIDDNTGKKRSVVEIYESEGKYFGKIVKLFREPGEEQDPVCDECEDYRKGKKIIGMNIITDMEKEGSELDGGEIMDPENGNIYKCKIWREDDELKVRGYLYFLYRTQTWLPQE
ncbi:MULTISPECIES: DUF2147 domain-containing protein [unclassified Imperialibacter]|uniref:DUF2147 domain-containing protein n=1 Tax=unclassified Imperialibacter TaxID=2629706 RepID=UPI00125618DB|nr:MULTISPECIES: DUF2147 domain-containing protein [unclassified Imperialibacter]CAD5257967.1 conserved exported hypothetical protein [Imperialibacter sp. 89]CAD5273008.1 conserved exported hypothetical protein [Imperialibacter sp. 75]VVT32546.1 conserved exported hypothetical protein [Imperialibacter sp. EC-SDR9]